MRDESAELIQARAAAAADAAFGADMYQVLAENAADTVFSPASVASALRMALCGARGQTAAELACTLRLDGSDGLEDVAISGLRLLAPRQDSSQGGGSGIEQGGGSATFRAPNTVWIQSGLPVRPDFTARLHEAAATLADADFTGAPETARALINGVIAEQTEGKITGLLPPGTVTQLTRLVLASAVYLKAAWTQPFPESATADAPFYPEGPDRPGLTVPMMHLTAPQAYLRGDGYQAVLLPYRDIGLAMAVLLPDGPLRALRPKVAAVGLGGLLAGTARHQVTLSLPRFRLEAAFNLIPALQRLGTERGVQRPRGLQRHHPSRAAADRRGRAQGVYRRRRARHGGRGGHRDHHPGHGGIPPSAAGHDGRGPAVPVRGRRHRDQPARLPGPGQPPGYGVINGLSWAAPICRQLSLAPG